MSATTPEVNRRAALSNHDQRRDNVKADGGAPPDVADLTKYLEAGAQLATQVGELQVPYVDSEILATIESNTGPVISVHELVRGHCKSFIDDKYPSNRAVYAREVRDYARKAGGDVHTSCYATIIEDLVRFDDTTNTDERKDLRKTIDSLIDAELKLIAPIVGDAVQCAFTHQTFLDITSTDKTSLKECLDELNTEISKRPLPNDKFLHQKSQEEMATNDLWRMRANLAIFMSLLDAAVTATGNSHDSWVAIVDNLKKLQYMVDHTVRTADKLHADIILAKMVAGWNALAETADRYCEE